MLKVLDPTGAERSNTRALNARVNSLEGLRLAALFNGRSPGPGRGILEGLTAILQDRHGLAKSVVFEKPYLGNVAPREMLEEIAASADVAITGVGD